MNIIFTILFCLNNGLDLVMHDPQFLSQYTALLVVAENPLHMTMAFSREYTFEKTHINPLGNIGKAWFLFHLSEILTLALKPHKQLEF